VDALGYCRDKAAPEGSWGHYATVFFSPPARAGLVALLALERELVEVVEACSDATVATRKLAYWHEELARLLDDAPTHPVTRALAEHARGALDANLTAGLIDGVRARIEQPQVPSTAALEASCRHTAGTLGVAAARLLSPGDTAAMCAARRAAAAAERARLLGLPCRAGLPPHAGVPQELLVACRARPVDVDRGGSDEPLVRLRLRLLRDAQAALLEARRALPRRRGYAAIRTALALTQLHALERGGYPQRGEARPALPIALLWQAWRHRP
jgi:phytoene synthase